MVKKKNKTILECTCELKGCGKSWESQGEEIPERCRWCGCYTWNGKNMRVKRLLTAQGKTQRLYEWVVETGIGGPTIRNRLNWGWTNEEALGFVTRERKGKQ